MLDINNVKINEKTKKVPHLLKYMGSKREILDFVTESIYSLNAESEWLCDLFSGTGVVGGTLKDDYKVHANDVQEYSSIMTNTYLLNLKGQLTIDCLEEIKNKVDELVDDYYLRFQNLKFDYSQVDSFTKLQKLEKEQQNLIDQNFNIGFHLFTKYYSGTYWSYEQCIWIDSIRAVAEQYKSKPQYYPILSSLIFAMSYVSPSTGHYAQYRDVTKDNMTDILSYRNRELWPYFERKFIELIENVNGESNDFRVTTLDYLDCLRIIEEDSIVYADPPYQSVHYSRFYHALETLVKYDYPTLKFKGRYREDRHQSPFCKKTTVNQAFSSMFEGVKLKKSHLALSYSDTGMISLRKICNLAEDIFGNDYSIKILTKEHVHSKMGRSDMKEQNVLEYIINFKRNV